MSILQPFQLFNQLKLSLFAHPCRGHKMKVLKSWEGIKYPGFTYYPRPGEKDPPFEPTKLWMVQKLSGWKKMTLPQKKILTSMGLGRSVLDTTSVAVVKNTTDMNARLWEVKQHVKVTPITTPDGLPSDGDYSAYHLDTNTGVFRIKPELKPSEAQLEASSRYLENPKKINVEIWKKETRLRWVRRWD